MKVVLAGYNTDRDNPLPTPETISAAYARISRDPSPVTELRREAASEVESARESNRRIVFRYGHGSVAEHAVFNLDILGVSRLAVEALQSFRLASFTEKSQRYIRIGEDWFLPPDTRDPEGFTAAVEKLFSSYERVLDRLKASGTDPGSAREDARYLLPLAALSQMGMTVNARQLEHMIRRLRAHPLGEVNSLAEAMFRAVEPVAPSLLLFTSPTGMDRLAHRHPDPVPGPGVELLQCDNDRQVAQWLERLYGPMERKSLYGKVYADLGVHDPLPRSWELFRAVFSVTLSASAYAQLKRHRMCTQLVTRYSPSLGITVPPSIRRAGLEDEFIGAAKSAEKAAVRLDTDYLLTNAHRRQVLLSMNGRELYHFMRLREDSHAQWDIRAVAEQILALVSERAPSTMAMACGKSRWEQVSGRPVR